MPVTDSSSCSRRARSAGMTGLWTAIGAHPDAGKLWAVPAAHGRFEDLQLVARQVVDPPCEAGPDRLADGPDAACGQPAVEAFDGLLQDGEPHLDHGRTTCPVTTRK